MSRAARRAAAVLAVWLLVLTTSCSVPGTPRVAGGPAPSSGQGVAPPSGRPAPLAAAIKVTGKADRRSDLISLDAASVVQISPDGSVFTIAADRAQDLAVGRVFVIDGIASRKVSGVTITGATATVQTVQATPDEIFSDLDVDFDGVPDPAGVIVDGDPVVAAGGDPLISSEPVDDADPSATTGTSSATATPTTKLRTEGHAVLRAACRARSVAFSVTADPITITPTLTSNADCSGFTLSADVKAEKGALSAAITLGGTVSVLRMNGHVAAGASGSSTSAGVQLKGDLSVGGTARAEEKGGIVRRFKMSWDALKVDYPVIIDGVPFVVRVGVPIIVEPRFSGRNDTIQGQLLGVSCAGQVLTGAESSNISTDICTMNPASITSFTNLAPSGFVVAAGFKVGFGPGVVVAEKAVAFAGGTVTLAGALGVTSTGATSTGLLDCIQVDRSLSINVGVEAKLGDFAVQASRTLKEKKATDYMGSRCPSK